jgi:hypothetical protein
VVSDIDEDGGTILGNARLHDVGLFLRQRIADHFTAAGSELNLEYIDPSYAIRSVPANPYNSASCLRLARNAMHAAMAVRTAMVVGRWRSASGTRWPRRRPVALGARGHRPAAIVRLIRHADRSANQAAYSSPLTASSWK